MSVADDYGRYFAHPGILRATCYPLQLDRVSEADVKQWLSKCVAERLITLYGDGKYLIIENFRQQIRGKSKFPEPAQTELLSKGEATDKHLCSESGSESESGSKAKPEAGAPPAGISAGENDPETRFTWEMCLSWIRQAAAEGADYTEFEARSAWLALCANGWMWGRNPVVDYRAALERQIQSDRKRNDAKSNGRIGQRNHTENPRNAGTYETGTDFKSVLEAKRKRTQMARQVAADNGALPGVAGA